MKRISALALYLTATSLTADCIDWEAGIRTGYRQDRLTYQTFDPERPGNANFEESFKHIHAYQFEIFSCLRLWWIELGIEGSGAWAFDGKVNSTLIVENPLSSGQSEIPFRACTDGGLWDAYGTVGLRVPFFSQKCFWFSLTPLGGYSVHHQSLDRSHVRPDSVTIGAFQIGNLISNPTTFSLESSTDLERTYWGPLVGGSLNICHNCFDFNVGYSYHWLELKQTTDIAYSCQSNIGSPLTFTGAFVLENCPLFKNSNSIGQRGWVNFDFFFCQCWRFGLRGTYFQVKTSKNKSGTFTTATTVLNPFSTSSAEPVTSEIEERSLLRARWRTFSVLLEIGYAF